MATPINLEGRIIPNEVVKFAVEITVGDITIQSRTIEFTAPPAIELINRLKDPFTYEIKKEGGSTENFTKDWKLDKFQKIVIGNDEPGLRVRIDDSEDDFKGLGEDQNIKFVTGNSGNLSSLDGESKKIIAIQKQKTNERRWVKVKLTKEQWNQLPGSNWDNSDPQNDEARDLTVPANNIIRINDKRKIKHTQIGLEMSPNVNSRLINKEDVRDVIVYAFSQFNGAFNSKVKRYYLQKQNGKDLVSREDEVNENSLGYAKAKELFFTPDGGQRLKYNDIRFDPEDGKKIILYAAIVRFIRDSKGNWKRIDQDGEEEDENKDAPKGWLQLNQEDRVIWLRAVEK